MIMDLALAERAAVNADGPEKAQSQTTITPSQRRFQGGDYQMTMKKTLARLALTTAAVAFGATMALADGTVVAVVGGKADDPFFA